ncbi:HAD-IIIA family hydrolase [Phormidium sp. CCY1219]|uniref:HAD-IIIA family hydrolase n=1 Tax=Phormidium sp. CCY1219 TaxID=2886104 RepID=UPI002D1ECF6C|nr:HAD-IIIA family hydrolase [Phormidium sp. CCY1219]MEB3827119.1 HAD-IIIA family hydrolase [Phormidium sp. CCY1219]
MTPIFFADKDGTLIETASGAQYVNHPEDQRPLPGATEAIAQVATRGYAIVGITNQAGVEAGHKTLEDCIQEMVYLLHLFPKMDCIFFCPNFKGHTCYKVWLQKSHYRVQSYENATYASAFRKPGWGMLEVALKEYHADPSACFMTGDRPEDCEAATAAGVTFIDAQRFRQGAADDLSQPNSPTA